MSKSDKNEMSKEDQEKYAVDVNSGAAPQPGAWVGPHGVELGYASPSQEAAVEETSQDAKMGVKPSEEEVANAKALETQAVDLEAAKKAPAKKADKKA